MTGREQDRERRRRRGDPSSARRPERARRTTRGGRDGARTGGFPPPWRRQRVGPGTGGAFGLSSTRRAALLALVVCALALSVAVPLRTYLSQRAAVQEEQRRQGDLRREVEELRKRRDQLDDPAQVEAEARRRLRFVRPGETPYVVQLPPSQQARPTQHQPEGERAEWYTELWNSISGSGS
ncbi:FtsB family cell division protein [Streptoalloteichus hindustanus]|uniref:Cell division protein FtsB n=1 Tax=Streptoalloteichus hindustanus TaxID=2017 RepID=A0A1M5KUZ1_STRHI|nr:septum formation initiator family protein [Streptoalloteichus hindustanus]SHG55983.1 Cell division protein FtsB [Streptoalloteichus hindustanus]